MLDLFDFADDDILPQSDRLQILSPEEYELLWGSPRFSLADRDLFFSLNRRDEQTLARLRTPHPNSFTICSRSPTSVVITGAPI